MKIKVTKLDSTFSLFVRLLSGGYCRRCKKQVGYKNLQNAHFHGRIRHTVRWDKRNTAPLCAGCHYDIDNHPVKKVSFFADILSDEDFYELNRIAELTTKDYPIDQVALYKEYTEGIKRLEE